MTIGGQESFDLPGVVPAEMEPGVVLLHHVMVLHGSVRNRSNSLRRAIYFESRSLSWNQEFLWYYDETMEKRCLLYQHALAERRANPYAPDDESFAYTPPPGMACWAAGHLIDRMCERVDHPVVLLHGNAYTDGGGPPWSGRVYQKPQCSRLRRRPGK